jgi:hypothetical protein
MNEQLHAPADLERARGTNWVGGWVGPTAGLDYVKKRRILTLPGIEPLFLGRLARCSLLRHLTNDDFYCLYIYLLTM